ncbi:MAG: hypothetical protein ACFE95_00520 [Candidatus Hodarchaeota archaeon]
MVTPDHSERIPLLVTHTDIAIQSTLSMKIRGSNFHKKPATIFVDSNQNQWLWKDLTVSALTREYLVSFLASQLGLLIPRSLIAKKNHSLGLIQEWISNGKELYSSSKHQMNNTTKIKILNLIIFEAWIGALDRHGGNYLTYDGEVWAIDFEDSFATKTRGSELCLYFPWIKESQDDLNEAIQNFKSNITKKRLLKEDILFEQFSNLLKALKDPRAKIALRNQLSKMHDLLQENFLHLETLVNTYLHQDHPTYEFFDKV